MLDARPPVSTRIQHWSLVIGHSGVAGVTDVPCGSPTPSPSARSCAGIGPGVPVRATVSDFGHQLLAKVLGANETQEQSLALLFRFADEQGLPLVDLPDLRA